MPPDVVTEQPAITNGAEFGLSAEEQAAYDSMRSATPPTGEPGHVEPEAAHEPAPTPAAETPAPAQADGAVPPVDADDDGDEEPAPPAGSPGAMLVDGEWVAKRVARSKYVALKKQAKENEAAIATEREKNTKSAETQARLDERLRLINEALTPPAGVQTKPEDDDPEPDPEADIFGHNAWLKRQLVKTQQAFDERIGHIETTRQAETSEQQLASTYMDDARQFAQTEQNFGPAYAYLMQMRTAQLANFHFGKDLTDPATPPLTAQEFAKIKGEVAREEKALVGQAIKAGKSPAQAVFAMARMSGYRPQSAAVPTAAAAPANGVQPAITNGAAPAAPAPAAKPTVRGEIERIKAAQGASLSLSHGGGTPAPVLDARKLADMPDEEFGALLENMSRGDLRRVMGG